MTRAPVATALCTLAALAAPAAAATDRQSRVIPLPVERTLSLEVTNASVAIEGWARADASIEIVRHAPTPDALTGMPVEIDEAEAHVRVSATSSGSAQGARDATEAGTASSASWRHSSPAAPRSSATAVCTPRPARTAVRPALRAATC